MVCSSFWNQVIIPPHDGRPGGYIHIFKIHKHSPPALNQNLNVYKAMANDGLSTVVCMDIQMDFHGDLVADLKATEYFNRNLIDARRGISLPKTINVPPEED